VLREVTRKSVLRTPHAVTERELSEPALHNAGQYEAERARGYSVDQMTDS
jgi:hypothetical protein